MEITVGGVILFEPFAAKLTGEGAESLERIGEILKGHRNKIDIVGHAAEQPRPADWTYTDAMQLSYDRARHVADELVRRGVDPRTIRMVAVGDNEPVAPDGLKGDGENRRVEIVVRESMIDDYRAEQPARQSERPVQVTPPMNQNPPASRPEVAGPAESQAQPG
jgi:flagellar motor protein MotB